MLLIVMDCFAISPYGCGMHDGVTRISSVSAIALATMIYSLVVILGWVFQSLPVVQLMPASAPMQFNTAFCFFLCGLSLLLLDTTCRWLSLVLAVFCAAFALVTLSQDVFNVNYGIDTLFIQPFTAMRTTQIGRMAPNTATAFLFLATGLGLGALPVRWRPAPFLVVLNESLATALGLVPLLGFISGVETASGWENFARMAVHTSILFVLLGSLVIIRIWHRLEDRALWLPLPVAIGMSVVTISMAQAVLSQQHQQLEAALQANADHLASETEQEFQSFDLALGRIVRRWQAAGGLPRSLWESDMRAYLNDYPFLSVLARLDVDGRLMWSAGEAKKRQNIPILLAALAADKTRIMQGAHGERHSQNAGLVHLKDGTTYLMLIYPLSHGRRQDGFLLAAIDLDIILTEIVQITAGNQVYLSVFEREQLIYTMLLPGIPGDNPWLKTAAFESELTPDWTFAVIPTQQMLRNYDGRMSWVVFGVGLILSFLATLALFLLLKQQRDSLKIREGKVRLRAIFKHAADGITLIDGRGNIEDFNPACEALFGYSAAEVIGKNVKILMPEPYHGEHDGYLAHFQSTGQKKIIGVGREITGRRKDGTEFDIDLRVSEVSMPGRTLYMGMFRDITERKREESTRQRLIDKLTESNTELERFAYVASHDLREPLRIVTNFAMLLISEYRYRLDKEGREYIAIIKEAATRMYGMVNDLLEYARIGNEEKRFVTVNVEAELRHVLGNLSAFIEEHKAIITHDPLPDLQGNPVQIMRLLQNLIGNTIKFHSRDVVPQVHISVEQKEGEWQFSVSDNGIGMAPQYTQQIFEPFRQLHGQNEYMGTGIGLAICKRIVEKHRGNIWVVSEQGKGSIFYFTLPAQEVN